MRFGIAGFSPHWSVLVKGQPVLVQGQTPLVKGRPVATPDLAVVHYKWLHKLMVMLWACL